MSATHGDTRLPGQQRERLLRGLQICAALMMFHLVAGKAARDGYFLTWFGPSRLPEMVAAASVVSLLASFLAGRLLARSTPARLLPSAVFISGLLHFSEWFLLVTRPRIASVAVYLHVFAFGLLLLSGFWSVLSEEFDPREAKVKIGRVAAAGTAGGLAGGILGERVVALFRAESLLLLLGLVHLMCGFLLWRILREFGEPKASPVRLRPSSSLKPPAQDVPYLATLAALVLVSGVSAVLLDFAFKFSASSTFGNGPDLVRFFALFYAGTSLLTLVLQSTVSRRLLETAGLGKTMGMLPATVIGGSLTSMLFPGINLLSAARAAESSVHSGLFRAGYEVCLNPLPPLEKRRMKPLIDVGAERLGDVAGSAVAKLVLVLAVAQPSVWILSAACVLGCAGLILATMVDRAYVRTLARSLLHRGAELDLNATLDLTTRTVLSQSGHSSFHSLELPPTPPSGRFPAAHRDDPVLFQLACLRSPDTATARAALEAADPAHPLIAAQLIQLLVSPKLGVEAFARLQPVAGAFIGLLCDHLRDPGQDFRLRRKIPGLLAGLPGPRPVEGLMAGLGDERFEVRHRCSQALLKLKRAESGLSFDRQAVLAVVDRELSTGRIIQEGQRMSELDSQALDKSWLDEFLKERAHVGLEHVFTLLALLYPEEPLLVAFRALHVEDRRLRATALEYLDGILPPDTRRLLFQLVGEQPVASQPRDSAAVLDDLMKASATVVIKLKGPEKG